MLRARLQRLWWQPGVASADYHGDVSTQALLKTELKGGEINAVCGRLSCVSGRFMLQWTLDVGGISWLTFKQKTKKLHLHISHPSDKSSPSFDEWVIQLEVKNNRLLRCITQHFGFCWDPFPKLFQLLGLLKEKPSARWKVRDSLRSLFTYRMKGYPDPKVLLNKHGVNVRVFLEFLVLTHAKSPYV